MSLRYLSLGTPSHDACIVGRDTSRSPDATLATVPCAYCGGRSARWQFNPTEDVGAVAACGLCHLALHLDRPRIDEEVMLVWLPELSQPLLNAITRHIHVARRAAGESVVHGVRPPPVPLGHQPMPHRHEIHFLTTVLAARAVAAADRLGTSLPSELAVVLRKLTPAAREYLPELLSGLRILPLGRFYVGETDVYLSIVDDWRTAMTVGVSPDPDTTSPGSPARLAGFRIGRIRSRAFGGRGASDIVMSSGHAGAGSADHIRSGAPC